MIVPVASISSSRAEVLRKIYEQRYNILVSSYDTSPSRLFSVDQRLTIWIAYQHQDGVVNTSRYYHWNSAERDSLLQTLQYVPIKEYKIEGIPKLSSQIATSVMNKLTARSSQSIGNFNLNKTTEQFAFYQEATRYWIKSALGLPYYEKDGVVQALSHGRYIYCDDDNIAASIFAILNSSLFYLFFVAWADGFHVSSGVVNSFPINKNILQNKDLAKLGNLLDDELRKNALRKEMNTSQGYLIRYDEYRQSFSKNIIDEIDRVLAQHYGFTDEELDFIINYDIKYRMGSDLFDDEGDEE